MEQWNNGTMEYLLKTMYFNSAPLQCTSSPKVAVLHTYLDIFLGISSLK